MLSESRTIECCLRKAFDLQLEFMIRNMHKYKMYAWSTIYLRNKFHFSEIHGRIYAMGYVQSRRHVNFAQDPLRSYFHEPQKNEIHLLYLYFVFTSFLFSICEVVIKLMQSRLRRKVINRRVWLFRSIAITMTWCQSNVTSTSQGL